MKKGKERRRMKRWKVAVLVRCSLPHITDDIFEMEMWAKDVNEKGMQLEWARGLTVSRVKKSGERIGDHNPRFDDIAFKKGAPIQVQDLFYDDDGSPFMDGKILWARRATDAGNWALGIEFVKSDKQTKDQLGAFKDFISIVKNPTAAITKASKKKK